MPLPPIAETLPEPEPEPAALPEEEPPPKIGPVPLPEVTPPSVEDIPDAIHVLDVGFFGAPITIRYAEALTPPLDHTINEETISAFWMALSNAPYETCLTQAQQYRERMGLNDWGYCQLLHAIGTGFYPNDRNAVRLFGWFMLVKSGYMARIGYYSNQVFLLLPATHVLYDRPYFTFEASTQRFYAVSFEEGGAVSANQTVYTYEGNYPGADRIVDLTIDRPPRIGNDARPKTLTFNHRSRTYDVPVTIDPRAVAFYGAYPQTQYEIYFTAPLSSGAHASLLPGLKSLITDRSEVEAVNMLLHFVQTAFQYQTDGDQFQREKAMFPDETLYYPSSDCEDRAILFAYLVRNLLGLEVIGLDYPGHIATAVRFSSAVSGDTVRYQDKTFVICDPTYVNADIGKPIPQVAHLTPEMIRIGGN